MAGVGVGTILTMAASAAATESARRSSIKASNRSRQNQVSLLNARYAAAEENRQQELKRASARQRARFSAQGLSSADGSSSAVLDGMKTLSEQQAQERDTVADLQRRQAASGLAHVSSGNLLTRHSPMLLDNMSRLMNWD